MILDTNALSALGNDDHAILDRLHLPDTPKPYFCFICLAELKRLFPDLFTNEGPSTPTNSSNSSSQTKSTRPSATNSKAGRGKSARPV